MPQNKLPELSPAEVKSSQMLERFASIPGLNLVFLGGYGIYRLVRYVAGAAMGVIDKRK